MSPHDLTGSMAAPPWRMLERVRAVTLDLDDTLWATAPTIEHAEATLRDWLQQHAPRTALRARDQSVARAARQSVLAGHPGLAHDLGFIRRETIRTLLQAAGESPQLAEPAFEVFLAARQCVTLFPDALPALQRLAARWPLVALTNGNADVHRIGIGSYFRAVVSASDVGVGKPDARMFHAGAAAAGVAIRHVLHVGDDLHLDVLAALAAGMQAIWVDRRGEAASLTEPTPPLLVVERLDRLLDGLR